MYKVTLAAARVNAGLSQKAAAKALGISNRTICAWEQGTTFPNADKIALICELYKIPYELLNFCPDVNLK